MSTVIEESPREKESVRTIVERALAIWWTVSGKDEDIADFIISELEAAYPDLNGGRVHGVKVRGQ